jgi:hypothetical protein
MIAEPQSSVPHVCNFFLLVQGKTTIARSRLGQRREYVLRYNRPLISKGRLHP